MAESDAERVMREVLEWIVAMPEPRTEGSRDGCHFKYRLEGESEPRDLYVMSGVYRDAVAAIPAILGVSLPIHVEIWCEHLIPDCGPYYYRVRPDEFGGLVVEHLIPPQTEDDEDEE